MTTSPASPNYSERRGGAQPELIVLHYTGMGSAAAARARLCDPAAEVSAHWLIAEDGTVEALVPEAMRAWHAGAGAWAGREDVNSRSIGIELANTGDAPFPEPQMAALERLIEGIMARWAIVPEAVIAHSDMAPGRKIDPGPRFDWARLARQGLAVMPEAGGMAPPVAEAGFMAMAETFGYPEAPFEVLLAAFRLRFRPRHTGPLDATDMALITDLGLRFGADGGSWRSS
ncbi:N-acetylmuramoyl-L-alanine amidase [Rhodobacter aestuarii]|uniref:N-acetylmuramoyl-L-alanine amidase n=1 Tax=Rhodobacter aestuarii TaxID=453582 RepID=A0A1N7MUA7_9RHOB|nr:N-acetylmuramoyl-L-alanine amidase [Rhodobacter aestuarii]PTV96523.1 N-acetylmuramoyl-L-alanine amidase [Rhodobacter aestuarii]SIS89725.1 N-acetylmuramoyl-L-alanine amidase [Rhodobacter aestuarii]